MDELDEPIENQEEFTAIMMVQIISFPIIDCDFVLLLGIWSFISAVRPHHL